MTTPLEELKIRARLLRKALLADEADARRRVALAARQRRWPEGADGVPTLGRCLNVVAVECGFDHWAHARQVLAGGAAPGEDLGRLWYGRECASLLSPWFARYDEALEALRALPGHYLLPHGRQFIVADRHFILALGMDPDAPAWRAIAHDLVGGRGSAPWAGLVLCRLAVQAGRAHADAPDGA